LNLTQILTKIERFEIGSKKYPAPYIVYLNFIARYKHQQSLAIKLNIYNMLNRIINIAQ